ncbi:MAG: exo-alpha-sialidase [Verrucomicrobia bacterium]|nr:exo-alpha-sialidase [Verrucomicrobiota bacterium]
MPSPWREVTDRVKLSLPGPALLPAANGTDTGSRIVLALVPTRVIPRNSAGSFATRRDGGIVFCYTQYYGGDEDHSAARIAAIKSDDGGRSWSEPRVIIGGAGGQGLNVMSVSLLRLASGRLALFYLFTRNAEDCGPYLCYSEDDGATWTTPRLLIDSPGCYVLNNDRAIQTQAHRLILPMNLHRKAGTRGMAAWYYSDDEGATWRESDSRWGVGEGLSGLQESGVVQTDSEELFSWARTDLGSQYGFRSTDWGMTWSAPQASPLISPLSAASIKRLPDSRELFAVYHNHSGHFPFVCEMRMPLVAAISRDEGVTCPWRKLIEADTCRSYHYVAMHFTPSALLLTYNAGNARMAKFTSPLRLRRIDFSWLRRPA